MRKSSFRVNSFGCTNLYYFTELVKSKFFMSTSFFVNW